MEAERDLVNLAPTMVTLEAASPVLMMALALERAVANLDLMMALERVVARARNLGAEMVLMMELDTKDLMMEVTLRAAVKAPVSQVLMTDTLEEENLAIMTTMVVTEEEMEVETVATMIMTLPCSPRTIFSQIWTSRTK